MRTDKTVYYIYTWKPDSKSAAQKLPNILWKPKVFVSKAATTVPYS
jgi:hypothetical protein